jgi:DNA-binding NarL/FixJ family response regulator
MAERPGTKVVLVTAIRDAALLQQAAAVGIADLLVKPFTVGQCLARLRFVLCRSFCVSWPNTTASSPFQQLTVEHGHPSAHALREVEKAVLDYLAEGLMYKEIAVRIGRSEPAVRKLVNSTYGKLEVHDRVHALLKWRRD